VRGCPQATAGMGGSALITRCPHTPAAPCLPHHRPTRSAPGERLQARLQTDKGGLSEGVTGLRSGPARTGVRELTYRLVFIANGTQVGRPPPGSPRLGGARSCPPPCAAAAQRSACWLGCAQADVALPGPPPSPSSPQPLDQKSGMINIRADDDQEPEEVLAQFSLEQRVRGKGGAQGWDGCGQRGCWSEHGVGRKRSSECGRKGMTPCRVGKGLGWGGLAGAAVQQRPGSPLPVCTCRCGLAQCVHARDGC
jgi:hypothetical protein